MDYKVKGTNKHPKDRIDFFGGKYHFLCNFYECPVSYGGLVYGSSEAAFAAHKLPDERAEARGYFTTLGPGPAKSKGRALDLRPDWEQVKYRIMSEVVHAKFAQHPDLAKKLLKTGDAILIEGNYWKDTTWGVVDGVGKNWLGIILMAERAYLKQQNTMLGWGLSDWSEQ